MSAPNCRPGDRAVVIANCQTLKRGLAGLVVDVLYERPPQDFHLPDGTGHYGSHVLPPGSLSWVCRLDEPVRALADDGKRYLTHYGCILDINLRPLRDPDAPMSESEQQELAV